MEIDIIHIHKDSKMKFKIDLIVWKYASVLRVHESQVSLK